MIDATLLVIQGPEQGRRYELVPESMHVGRGGQNEIRVLDTEASRQHALLAWTDGDWVITDLDSSNGTYVNGRAIKTAVIRPGDQIQVGRTILLYTGDTQPREYSAGEKINLVARSSADDQSRIVSQAKPSENAAFGGWTQAGDNLQLLYRITEEVVSPTTSLDELLQRVLDLTLEAVGADRGCMLVADSKTDRIEPRVVAHRGSANVNERMPISTSIVEYVIYNGQGVRTSDAQHDSRFDTGQSIVKSGIREAMCVPMRGRYELMGVIYVDTTRSSVEMLGSLMGGRFNDQLLLMLLAIGRQSALAIENYRYQDALVTSERLAAIGQTITIMSHHIKNILQGLQGGGYLIDSGLKQKNDEMIRKGWGVVERNQNRIYNLVMDLLTFSKEREPRLTMSDISEVLRDVLELMEPRLTAASIQSAIVPAPATPLSLFDAEGFHRAILNIVTNAIDALDGQPNPRLEIRYGLDQAREQMWVEIEDNGPGIDDAELPRLFSLFESTKGFKGTGLGLAVSRKILQEHGGTISVRTKAGIGTSFRLEWPYQSEEAELSAE
ncbi:sensor histidine kinase [Planctomicrobium piriforme]|uniref:histidine kinase n=1 Tax=Planctomicrobium piriforme TaxID=1576369 RepID=A0A1I3HWP2_9PLAN|nr:ATP-binding protein [Planctomicrobium piriforme]SFI40135.1 GAF domain-containing protein [Planctomicrobium piriforme]